MSSVDLAQQVGSSFVDAVDAVKSWLYNQAEESQSQQRDELNDGRGRPEDTDDALAAEQLGSSAEGMSTPACDCMYGPCQAAQGCAHVGFRLPGFRSTLEEYMTAHDQHG